MRVLEAGDSAMLVQFEPVIDAQVNARVVAVAAALTGRSIAGVREVVPAIHSVAVHFDPLGTDTGALAAAIHEIIAAPPDRGDGKTIEIPVVYGGADGPDLDALASFAHYTTAEVIERHSDPAYRVFMLGFLPGFPYMASVDDAIAMPRHVTPRARVPAGSVGIAGRQTGIYPRDSPGGWQIIGRTTVSLFDPARQPPGTLSPGDVVKFVPVASHHAGGVRGTAIAAGGTADAPAPLALERSVTVVQPGLSTTVQDVGRWGYQFQGVAVSGAMDPVAHRLANALVGNSRTAATIEVTLAGPELRFAQRTRVAVAGADLSASIDDTPVPRDRAVECGPGSLLRFGRRREGARAYVACDGGICVPPVLGSRSTHVVSGLGGMQGRRLRSGDLLPLGPAAAALPPRSRSGHVAALSRPATSPALLRVMPGPQAGAFEHGALDVLERGVYAVSSQSDRMGYRLTGGVRFRSSDAGEMISDAVFVGAVQVPPSGDPILLMADRQTTGGYPQIAIVITADLPVAAQLAPGDTVRFEFCSRTDAVAALIADEKALLALE